MIEIQNVTKRFAQGKLLFQNVTLKMGRGDFIVVTGPSGAGKTSLLQMVYGFLRPSEGQVLIENRDLYKMPPYDRTLLRRQMGFVFQDFRLINEKTVAENVGLPLAIQNVPIKQIRREVDRVLDRFGLRDVRDELPSVLSGGTQQKVAAARAVIHQPRWLFADEPTGNLDPLASREMMDLFGEVHHSGTSVIVATHDENLVQNRPGVCVRLERGCIRGEFS